MKVGISFSSSADLRFSGANQTAILLGELMLVIGHTVTFVDRAGSTWWTDVPRIAETDVTSLYDAKGLDVLLDVDGIVSPELRATIASQTIVFLRSFVQFMEMDATVYPEVPYVPRSMKGVSEIWCWDLLNPVETIPSIQALFPCPIRRVPFVWSSSITDWMSGSKKAVSAASNTASNEWIIHIAEKNNHNTSSAVLPLVAVRELTAQHAIPAKYVCHHVETILENRFLKENVLYNIEINTLPVIFAPTESYSHWIHEPYHALFSHTRFLPLRTSLIQAVWMGLPLIHNSPILRDLHPVLAKTYYKGNHIQGISDAFQWLHAHADEWFAAQEAMRQAIGRTWGVSVHTESWRTLTQTAFSAPVEKKTVLEEDVPRKKHVVFAESLTETRVIPTEHSVTPEETSAPSTEILIGFSDMWPGFNLQSNFIMDLLRHESSRTFRGVAWASGVEAHLLIAGPYSTSWKDSSLPIVFFTAENWPPPQDPRIVLYLTSTKKEDPLHMRIPTWMTFIDWYSGSTVLPPDSQDNPIRLPLHFAMNPHPVPFEARSAFCAFVVSNPNCTMRNEAFQALHAYRPVTSGGHLYNNIGGPLSLKYPGGGSGDLSKHHFFSQHQFSLSFENAQADGYITEKVLHAKMAGCLPLYWGDADTDSDFAPNAILNVSRLGSASQIVEIVRQLEANPAMCAAIASTPLLNEEKKNKALTLLSAIGQRILSILRIQKETPIARISATFVINLETRRDRWDQLMAAEPYLAPLVTRIPAVYGKTLPMSAFVYRLFEKNQFQWKKSIIGCNLSHMSVWSRITQEKGDYFLILEDDVRFRAGWRETWAACAASIPADADLLYLGGVLPPNLPALPLATEAVNEHWGRIKPNTLFSAVLAPMFHFCAYSYILTKRGAEKLIHFLTHSDQRSFTVSDHLLGHPAVGLRTYFTRPLLSSCFQESDPVYVNSAFDDLHREDTFDSDIWNNKECFTESELAPFRNLTATPVPVPTVAPVPAAPAAAATLTMYYDSVLCPGAFQMHEQKWIEDMMSASLVTLPCQQETLGALPSGSWFIVQRPHSAAWNTRFQEMDRQGRDFYVLHLSDEFATDSIDFYSLPHCKGVIRNYTRADCPALPHVLTIPLGYHHASSEAVTPFVDRSLLWSFHGTEWFDRKTQLERLAHFVPYNCLLLPSWNHASMTKEKEYLKLLAMTKFCPVLRGNNMETFRLYEALEAGCLPVSMESTDPFLDRVERELDLSSLYAWKDPVAVIPSSITPSVQTEVSRRWAAWKERIRGAVRALL